MGKIDSGYVSGYPSSSLEGTSKTRSNSVWRRVCKRKGGSGTEDGRARLSTSIR